MKARQGLLSHGSGQYVSAGEELRSGEQVPVVGLAPVTGITESQTGEAVSCCLSHIASTRFADQSCFKSVISWRRRNGGAVMGLDMKSLEELEQLAANLRQQIVLHPEHSELDSAALRDVEEWIALRRQEKAASGAGTVI
jgi:hypothetical protein